MTTTQSRFSAMAGAVVFLLSEGQGLFLWMLPWYRADWVAIVVGGASCTCAGRPAGTQIQLTCLRSQLHREHSMQLRTFLLLRCALSSLGCQTTPKLGQTAPDFALTDSIGSNIRSSDYKGKVVVLTSGRPGVVAAKSSFPVCRVPKQGP